MSLINNLYHKELKLRHCSLFPHLNKKTLFEMWLSRKWSQEHKINNVKWQIKQNNIFDKRSWGLAWSGETLHVPFSCVNESLAVMASIYACFFAFYSCRPQGVCTYTCVSCAHSHELCSLTKHLFCAHTCACGAWWSSPNPQHGKVSAFFDVAPIDHHYYCSLLIPMEMRPAAVVLGDWGWGQGLPPLALLQNIKSS